MFSISHLETGLCISESSKSFRNSRNDNDNKHVNIYTARLEKYKYSLNGI